MLQAGRRAGNRVSQAAFICPERSISSIREGKNIMAKKIILALGITTMALTATACNTVRGAGQDLESAANTVDDEI